MVKPSYLLPDVDVIVDICITHIGITNGHVYWPEISALGRCLALASNDQFVYRVTDAV